MDIKNTYTMYKNTIFGVMSAYQWFVKMLVIYN